MNRNQVLKDIKKEKLESKGGQKKKEKKKKDCCWCLIYFYGEKFDQIRENQCEVEI